MLHKYRCLSDWEWEYATLDELCSNLWFDYGTPSNVIAFSDWEHKTKWTWLLDKNWKEIYEGDIVSQWRMESTSFAPDKRQVCFSDARFFLNGYFEENISERMKNGFWKLEVIWNIYENPNLL